MKYGAGGKVPAAAKSSDGSGERHGKKTNGVAMGKEDGKVGGTSTFNTGRSEKVCYSHSRKAYRGE